MSLTDVCSNSTTTEALQGLATDEVSVRQFLNPFDEFGAEEEPAFTAMADDDNDYEDEYDPDNLETFRGRSRSSSILEESPDAFESVSRTKRAFSAVYGNWEGFNFSRRAVSRPVSLSLSGLGGLMNNEPQTATVATSVKQLSRKTLDIVNLHERPVRGLSRSSSVAEPATELEVLEAMEEERLAQEERAKLLGVTSNESASTLAPPELPSVKYRAHRLSVSSVVRWKASKSGVVAMTGTSKGKQGDSRTKSEVSTHARRVQRPTNDSEPNESPNLAAQTDTVGEVAAPDCYIKVLLLGDSGVGKTSLMTRFSENKFHKSFMSTMGVDYKVRYLRDVENKTVKCQVWDTAGQERFHVITRAYYKGAHGIALVYDVTDNESLQHVGYWVECIRNHANEGVKVVLVGNKVDNIEEKVVTSDMGRAVARQHGIQFAECSALDGTNVVEMFRGLAVDVVKHLSKSEEGEEEAACTQSNRSGRLKVDFKSIRRLKDLPCSII